MHQLLLPFFHQEAAIQGKKKIQKNLTDITEIYVCSRQYLRQTELTFKFRYKTHIELFLVVS